MKWYDPTGLYTAATGGDKGKSGAKPPQFGGTPGTGSLNTGPGAWQQAAEAQGSQGHTGLQGVVGSSGWSQDPNTGQWTQKQSLNGPLAGAAQGYMGQIANQAPLDFSSLPQIDQGQGQMQKAQDAAYGQATSRLDPMFAQAQEQQQAQLANSGMDSPNMEANQNAWGNFNRAKTDAYGSAQRYSVGQGLQAQQQAYGQSMGARQQALAEMLKQRGMPAEQLQQLLGMMGGAQGVGQAGAPNYLGAMAGQQGFSLENQDMINRANGQFWNNIGQVGGTAASLATLSDERAKHHIERLPIMIHDGIPLAIFEFRHAPGKHLGVIAQDVLKVFPHLVSERSDGLLCVDYGGLLAG